MKVRVTASVHNHARGLPDELAVATGMLRESLAFVIGSVKKQVEDDPLGVLCLTDTDETKWVEGEIKIAIRRL